ncbi:MAG TPA: alpha/beta hydrolase [Virgibacillus sp.]|nr:alpha/beta hydrolase [Virgibacillus sp.]
MSLYYREYGDKSAPLIMFLHGGGVSSWMWDQQIQFFSHYHCIVPDLPEHGLNDHKVKFSIYDSAEALIKLIEEKANSKKVIIIGFSLGAQVLIQILSMKPTLIDYAMINSALVRPFPYAKIFIKPSILLSFPLLRYRWFAKLQAKTLYVNEDNFETYYEESSQITSDTLIRVLEENMTFKIPKNFNKAKGKILVTVGEKEKSIMKKSAIDIVSAHSNCTGVVIPHIGHGAPLAIPDFFNHMVERWIREDELPMECEVIK